MWTLMIYRREREEEKEKEDGGGQEGDGSGEEETAWRAVWDHVVSIEDYKNQVGTIDGVEVHSIVWAFVPIAIPAQRTLPPAQEETNNNNNNYNNSGGGGGGGATTAAEKVGSASTKNPAHLVDYIPDDPATRAELAKQEYLFIVNLSAVQFVSVRVSAAEDLLSSSPKFMKQCFAENVLSDSKRPNCTLQFSRMRDNWSRANITMIVNILDARRSEKLLDTPFLAASEQVREMKWRLRRSGLECCPFCMYARRRRRSGSRRSKQVVPWFNTEKRVPKGGAVQNNPLERYHIDTTGFRWHGWLSRENLDAHIALRHANNSK